MILQTWLRWLMRIVLPFANWRVPVVLLRGQDRVSGAAVTLLSAGARYGNDFLKERLFAQEPVVVRTARVSVWRLRRLLHEWGAEADMTVIGIDRVSARLFLRQRYLAVPMWMSSWMQVPDDLKEFARTHSGCQGDIRRVRIQKFESHFSREEKDFDFFYDRFYQPFIVARHGALVVVSARWRLRLLFRRGGIKWVSVNGERVAGEIIMIKGREYHKMVIGVLDGSTALARQGVLSALYVHAIEDARQRGCTSIHMGGSEPSPHDGVFRYKNKWASGISTHDGFVSANCVTLLDWRGLAGPVAGLLTHTSLFYHDQGGYSALWVFPHDEPLTAENLERHYTQLKSTGVRQFVIVLPGEPPADFVCPPEVRLIPMAAVGAGGPAVLEAWLKQTLPAAGTPCGAAPSHAP